MERISKTFELKNGDLTEKDVTTIFGAEKNKLFPTDVGIVVTDFLIETSLFGTSIAGEKIFEEIDKLIQLPPGREPDIERMYLFACVRRVLVTVTVHVKVP